MGLDLLIDAGGVCACVVRPGLGPRLISSVTVHIQRLQPSCIQLTKQQPQREDSGGMKTQANIKTAPEFYSFLNKQPCLSAASVAQSWSEVGPRRCRALSYSSFLVHSGESERVGESEGSQRQTEGEEEGAGLREFAGSLVYSVVVLTSERTPADTGGHWRLAHVNVVEIRTR